jgi:hypothetical protein
MMVPVAIISMPLLTELVSTEDAIRYRHGAPNGAVSAVDYVSSCALAINDVIHPPMNHSLRDAPDA